MYHGPGPTFSPYAGPEELSAPVACPRPFRTPRETPAARAQIARSLPWRPPATTKRSAETVRPIFWSNRPRAYVTRTADWDSYPSGRWGNAKSPAYGTLSDYQFMRRHTGSEKRAEKAKAAWGTSLNSLQDVVAVFVKYTSGAACCVGDRLIT